MKKIRTTRGQRWPFIIASNITIMSAIFIFGNIWIALILFPNWILCDRLITWGKEYQSLEAKAKVIGEEPK